MEDNKIYRKRNFLQRNLEYFLAWFSRDWKVTFEYKANTISSIVTNLFRSTVVFFILIIFKDNFGEILGWGLNEIIFFSYFSFAIFYLMGVFSHSLRLERLLLEGHFNIFLSRPINTFLMYILRVARTRRLLTFFFPFVFIVFFIFIKTDITLITFLITFLFSLYGAILGYCIYLAFDSFGFYMKTDNFLEKLYWDTESIFISYPISMFKDVLKNVTYLISFGYYSAYATSFIFGHIDISELYHLSKIITILIIVFSLITYINWKIGLKRYEAFG